MKILLLQGKKTEPETPRDEKRGDKLNILMRSCAKAKLASRSETKPVLTDDKKTFNKARKF